MLWQLQQNSQIIKQLPARSLPADFADRIVDTLKKTAAASPTPARAARFGPRIIRWACAAALLLAVGGGLLYFWPRPDGQQLANNENPPPENPLPQIAPNEVPVVIPKVETPKEKPGPFAAPVVFARLKQQPERKLLEDELKKGQSFRVDLYVKNINKLDQALKKIGTHLSFQVSQKKNKDKEFLIFVENLLPADVAGFLGELARDEKGPIDQIQLQPMSKADQTLLCERLKLDDPQELINPTDKIRLPNIIEGKDRNQPLPAPLEQKAPERRAVLLAKDDARQIRRFVDERGRLKEGTVQILFVMRTNPTPAAAMTAGQGVYISAPSDN